MTHTANNELTTGPGAQPENWPPQPADVWSDRYHNTWATLGTGRGQVEMHPTAAGGDWRNPDEVHAVFGPLRLEYRPEPDELAATVAGLRAMADFLEANRQLPRAYGFGGQISCATRDEWHALIEEYDAHVRYDEEKSAAASIDRGGVELVFYCAQRRPEPEPVATQPVEPDAEQTAIVEEDAAERRALEAEQCYECESTGTNCLAHSVLGSPGHSIYDVPDQRDPAE